MQQRVSHQRRRWLQQRLRLPVDQERVDDVEDRLEARFRLQSLQRAIGCLNEREQDILTARRLVEPPQTLQRLAQKHGVSVERVRQIEAIAFKKVAAMVQDKPGLSAA